MGFATPNAYLLQLIAATLAGNEADTYITISGYSRAVARSIDLEGLTLRDLGFESATDYLLQLIVATIAANELDTYLTKSQGCARRDPSQDERFTYISTSAHILYCTLGTTTASTNAMWKSMKRSSGRIK